MISSAAVPAVRLKINESGRLYELTVTADDEGRPQLEVIGCDPNGEQIAELRGWLPEQDLGTVARLLSSAAAALSGEPAKPIVTLAERRRTHPNSHQPWTEEDDQRLRELAVQPGATMRELTETFGRTRGAIRSRLDRLGLGDVLSSRPAPAPAD